MHKSNMSSSFLGRCLKTGKTGTVAPANFAPFAPHRWLHWTAAWQRGETGAKGWSMEPGYVRSWCVCKLNGFDFRLHFGTAPRPWTKWGAGGRGTWQLSLGLDRQRRKKNRNSMNFEIHWRQARSALSSRLPTSRTWNDRKIDRTFRTWHWHNLSLLDTRAPHLLLSLPRCKLLPFCHLVRRYGSTANQHIRRTRNSGSFAPPPSHWAQSAGVVPSRAGTWTCSAVERSEGSSGTGTLNKNGRTGSKLHILARKHRRWKLRAGPNKKTINLSQKAGNFQNSQDTACSSCAFALESPDEWPWCLKLEGWKAKATSICWGRRIEPAGEILWSVTKPKISKIFAEF